MFLNAGAMFLSSFSNIQAILPKKKARGFTSRVSLCDFWSHGRHTEIILEVGPDLWQRFLFMAAPVRPSSARPTNSWYRPGEMGKAHRSFARRLPSPKCIFGSLLNQISASFFPLFDIWLLTGAAEWACILDFGVLGDLKEFRVV